MKPIITKKFAKDNGMKFYHTGRPCQRGHLVDRYVQGGACIECSRLRITSEIFKEKARTKYAASKTEVRLYRQNLRKRNPEAARARSKRSNDKSRLYRLKRYQSRIDEMRAQAREYRKLHRAEEGVRSRLKIAKIKQATPNWVNFEALVQIYRDRPPNHHVDHTIPIRHNLVWGLNIPCNLESIPAQVNLYKHNYSNALEWAFCKETSSFVRTPLPDAPDYYYYLTGECERDLDLAA